MATFRTATSITQRLRMRASWNDERPIGSSAGRAAATLSAGKSRGIPRRPFQHAAQPKDTQVNPSKHGDCPSRTGLDPEGQTCSLLDVVRRKSRQKGECEARSTRRMHARVFADDSAGCGTRVARLVSGRIVRSCGGGGVALELQSRYKQVRSRVGLPTD